MATKLVVTLEGLVLSNLKEIVSSRSIDEVILVGSPSNFNKLTDFSSITTAKSNIASAKAGSTLSVAFANSSSATLSEDFYDYLASNNISFFVDSDLSSLSSSFIVEAGDVSGTKINSLNAFDTSTIANNIAYAGKGTLTLGSEFGSKPTITSGSGNFLSDLGNTIKVNISAARFAKILAAGNASKISVSELANLSVASDTPAVNLLTKGRIGPGLSAKSFVEAYNGSNRLGNIASAPASQSTPLTNNGYVWSAETTLNVSQALRLPLMGVIPAIGGSNKNKGILKDTAENIAIGLSTFTEGQVLSFSDIIITDNATLSLDAATFKKLDTVYHTFTWSDTDGLEVFNSNGTTKAVITVSDSLTSLTSAGLITSSGTFNTSLNNKDTNLVSQISTYKISASASTDADIAKLANIVSNKPTGKTVTLDLDLAANYGESGLSVSSFEGLAKLDAELSADLIKDKFPTGINIIDTADNIKSLITSTDSAVIPVKDYIKGFTSTNDSEVIELTWDQYIGALSGANFSKTNKSTWSNLTDEIAFKEIGNIELIVSGKASEIQDIVDKYGSSLSNFPSGITLKITDGGELTLKSAQLDVLDSRIDGKVKISDSNTNIGSLLDNAVSSNIKSIATTGSVLEVSFDQFRNLPKFYSADVVIKDTEKNIVDALNEDLLDDRVTTLVLTDQSKLIGTGVDDSALTLTAAAASNLLDKKVQSSSNYGTNSTYMPIKIVDRASAIANFIESATIPGAQTKANETGKIDFVEIDGKDITLNREQYRAYTDLSGKLVSSVTATIKEDTIFTQILDAISGNKTAITTNTKTITDKIDANKKAIDDNKSAITAAVSDINTNTDQEASTILSAVNTSSGLTIAAFEAKVSAGTASDEKIEDTQFNIATYLTSKTIPSSASSVKLISGDIIKLDSTQFINLLASETATKKLYTGSIKIAQPLTGSGTQVLNQLTDYRVTRLADYNKANVTATITNPTVAEVAAIVDAGATLTNLTYSLLDSGVKLKDSITGNTAILKKASAVETNDIQSTPTQYNNVSLVAQNIGSAVLTSTIQGKASEIAAVKDTLGGNLDITITSGTTDLDTFDDISKMTSKSEVKFASNLGLTETTLTKIVAGGGVLSNAYKNFKTKTTNIPLDIGTQILDSENKVTDFNALLGSGGNEGAVTGTLRSNKTTNFLTATKNFKITGSGHKITLNFGSVAADAGADVLTRLDSYIKDSNITVLNGTLTKVTGANAGSIAKDSKSAFNVTLSEDVTVQEGSNIAGATTGTVDYAKGVKDSIGELATEAKEISAGLKAIIDKTDAVDVEISNTKIINAFDIGATNKILDYTGTGSNTVGNITATFENTVGELSKLKTGNSDVITFIAKDSASFTEVQTLLNKTSASTIDFSAAGMTGTAAQFVGAGSAAVIAADADALINIGTSNNPASVISDLNTLAKNASHTGVISGKLLGSILENGTSAFNGLDTSGSKDLIEIVAQVPSGQQFDLGAANGIKFAALLDKTAGKVSVTGAIDVVKGNATQVKALKTSSADDFKVEVTGDTSIDDALIISKMAGITPTFEKIKSSASDLATKLTTTVLAMATAVEASTDADIAQAKTLSAFTKAITYNISDNAAAVSATGAETDLAIKEAVKVSVTNNLKVSEAVEMLDGHSNTGKFTYNLFDDASKLVDAKAGKPSAESKVAYDLAASKTLAPADVQTLSPIINDITGHTVVDTADNISKVAGILTNAAKVVITPENGSEVNVSSDTNERKLLKKFFADRKGANPIIKVEVKGNYDDIIEYSSGDKLRKDEINFTVDDEINLSNAKTLTSKTHTEIDVIEGVTGSSTISFTIKDNASNVIDAGNNFASFLDTGRPVVLTDSVIDVATAKKVLAKSPTSLKYTKISDDAATIAANLTTIVKGAAVELKNTSDPTTKEINDIQAKIATLNGGSVGSLLTYSSIKDTAENLAANTADFVKNIDITVDESSESGTVKEISDIKTAIDALSGTGKFTYTKVEDSISGFDGVATSLVKDLAITVTGDSSKTKFEALKTKVGGSGTTTGTIVDDPSNLTTTNAGANATIVAKLKSGQTDLTGVTLDSKVTKIDLAGFKTAKLSIKNLTGRTVKNDASGDFKISDTPSKLTEVAALAIIKAQAKQVVVDESAATLNYDQLKKLTDNISRSKITYTKFKDSLTNIKKLNLKDHYEGVAVEVDTADIKVADFSSLFTAVGGSGSVKASIKDDVSALDSSVDLTGATKVTAVVETGKGDLTSITLDDDVTDIDLNGVTTILSIDDATGRTIGAGTYSFQDTAEKLSKTSSKSLINGKAVKVNDDDTLDFDKYSKIVTTNGASSISFKKVSDIASTLETNKDVLFKNGVTVTISDSPKIDAISSLNTKATAVSANLVVSKIKDTAANINKNATTLGFSTNVDVTIDESTVSEIDDLAAINAKANSLTYTKVKDAAIKLKGANKALIQGMKVEINDVAGIKASDFKLILDEAKKKTGGEITAGKVADTVTALTTGKIGANDLTGSTSVTAVLDAGGGDADLSGVTLDSRVTLIDLNGNAATLDTEDLSNATVTGAGSYTIKDDIKLIKDLDKSLVKGNAITVVGAANVTDLDKIETTLESGAITYSSITDTATALAGDTSKIVKGVTVNVQGKAKGTELKTITDRGTAITAPVNLDKVEDSITELVKVKTLLKDRTVTLTGTTDAAKYKEILDEKPTSFAGEVVDTLTKLSGAVTLTNATKVTAQLESDGFNAAAKTLDASVTHVDLNGKKNVVFNVANTDNRVIVNDAAGTFKYKDTPTAIFDAKAYDDILKNQDVEFSAATNMFVLDKTKAVAKSLTYTDVSDRPAQLLSSKALWNDGKRSVVLKAADATVDQYEKLLVEVAKQGGSLSGGVQDSIKNLTKGGSALVLTGSTKVEAKLAGDGSDKDLTSVQLDSAVTKLVLNGQTAILDAEDLNNFTTDGDTYVVKDTSTKVAALTKAQVKGKAITLTTATNTADIKTIGTDNESGAITYTELTDSATAIAGTLGNIKSGVTVTLNTAATGQELSDISTKATGVTATLVAANVTDTAAELKKFKTLIRGKTVKLKTGETASAEVYDEISTEAVKTVGGTAGTFTGNVEDTVANLLSSKSLTLTGVGTVTAKLKVDGSDKDLTGKVLHSKVDEIDLNGQAATLDASHLGKTLATGGGTNYTIKDTSSEVAGLAKALVKGKAINITNATNTADLKTIGTTNESGAITYTKLTDSATAIAGTLGNIKNGVTVTLNTAATGQELSDISTKATGVTATLVAANVTDTAAELKKFKDLLKGKTVKLKDGETASAGVYDEISTEAVKKVGGIAGTFTGNVEDTVANLVKAKVLTLTGVGTVTAKLKSDGSDKDLTATDLHSKVTVIDLNSQAAVLDADDLSKTITGTTYTVKDTAEKIANLASSKFKGKTVQVTDRGKLSHIKTITDDAGSVTYKVKDTTTALVGANKALIQGIDVEISSATVSAANYNAILVEATKKAGGKVVGTVSDDISRIVAENKYSFTGNLDVIAKVESDNQDISALSLDTEIKKIDLNGKKGVIFSIENVRTGGVNKTIQDTPTGGSYKYKDTGSALSKDVNTIALIKNQTVEISDKVDMDTLKSISDSATAAKTTATLIEDTSAKLKDNKTLIAGTSGEKTVTLTTNSTSSVYDEILTEIKKTGGSASLKGAVVDSVDGLKVDRDLSGATSVIVEVTNATKDLTGITFDSEVTRVNLKDTKEVKFSMAHLKGQALNFIYDSGGQGNHLIEDSYADIVENSSTIAHARKLLRTKSLVVTDEIDTTKLADLKSKITTTTTIFDIKKIKDTAKNLIDNKDDITADAEITIDDASTIADTSQINALQLVSATVNYNKVHDSITLLKANKADLDKKVVTFSDSSSNATDYDALVTAVGTGKVIGAVIDTPTNLKDGKDLSNATSVTVRLTDTDNDLSGITLDSEVTAIDLNGQTGTFGIADIDNKSITSGTYIIKDTAAEILKAGDVDGSNAAKDVSKFKALWGASKIIVTGWTNEDLSKIGINTAETKAAATAASVNLGTTTIQLDVADTEAAQEITKAEAAKLATIDSINILGGKKITISNEAFKAGAIALNELDTITAGATGSEFIIKADTETNVDLGKISTIGTNISKITINGTTNADVIQLSKAFIGHKDATIDLSSGDGKADKVIFNVDKSQFSSTGSDTLNYINVTNFESSKDRVGLYYGGYSDSPKSAIKTLTSTAATTSGAANFNKDITYIEEDTTITSGTIADVDKVSEVKSVIADAVGNFNKPGVGEERRLFLSNYITNPEDFKTNAVLYSADMGGITEAKSDLAATDSFKVIGIASLVDVSEKSLGTLPMGNLANKPSDFV